MKRNFAVLGAGNGGQVISAYLKLCGKHVALYDRFPEFLAPILAQGGIRLEGVDKTGFAKLDLVTAEVSEAVREAEIIFVVLPAFAHAFAAGQLAPCLTDGQTVIICPGATGGALEFRAVFDRLGCTAKIKLAETNSLFYAARSHDGVATITGVKDELSLAALPASDTGRIIDELRDVYPQLVPAQNVLETSLNNFNTVVHPIPVLLNAGRIESGESFRHYFEGITPSVGRLMERLDAERLAVGAAYGVHLMSMRESYRRYYHAEADELWQVAHMVKAHEPILAPAKLDSRLLTEDVPMGLVPMAALGRAAGVPTPVIDSVIILTGGLLGVDFAASGRSMERLGIQGKDKKALLNALQG